MLVHVSLCSLHRYAASDEPVAIRGIRGCIIISASRIASCILCLLLPARSTPAKDCSDRLLLFLLCSTHSVFRVYRLYRGIGIRHLPVIDIDNKVVGILCRKELRTDWKGDSLI
jgi:hypothetical protein